jgi:hypothetical protein
MPGYNAVPTAIKVARFKRKVPNKVFSRAKYTRKKMVRIKAVIITAPIEIVEPKFRMDRQARRGCPRSMNRKPNPIITRIKGIQREVVSRLIPIITWRKNRHRKAPEPDPMKDISSAISQPHLFLCISFFISLFLSQI